MEHLLQKSKCSIFHNIFRYMVFQRHQKALLSKGLMTLFHVNDLNILDNSLKGTALKAFESEMQALIEPCNQ